MSLLTQACPDAMESKEASEADKEAAQKLKNEGNAFMKEKKFQEAVDKYSEAIKVQESAVFYCNRAAAYTSMENYEEALQDCKKAISFDPDYSKAYSRMGLIYSKINLFAESENCYEKALKLEPDNESYKKNIQIVKDKLKEQAGNPMAAMQGMPGMEGFNPAAMQAGMQMAQQMMQSNPDAVEEMRKEFMKQMGGRQK